LLGCLRQYSRERASESFLEMGMSQTADEVEPYLQGTGERMPPGESVFARRLAVVALPVDQQYRASHYRRRSPLQFSPAPRKPLRRSGCAPLAPQSQRIPARFTDRCTMLTDASSRCSGSNSDGPRRRTPESRGFSLLLKASF